ncbi:NnrS family protein, partial [bacterium]|nr:NnrS family protein [bacterium]
MTDDRLQNPLCLFCFTVWCQSEGGSSPPGIHSFRPSLCLRPRDALAQKVQCPWTLYSWVPWCAAVGWLAIIFVPGLRTGVLHLMFIGGSAIVMLAVSTRVILGHNDRHDRLALPMKWYHLVWSLLLLNTATRLSADFVPKVRISHLSYAACLWIIVIVFWS